MSQQWLYARDQITINAALAAEISAEATAGHLASGDTIVLAARQCTQDPSYLWAPQYTSSSGAVSWFNVIVVADRYVFASGSGPGGIGYNGTAGGNGAPGAAGAAAVFGTRPAVPGGNGAPGTPGGAGCPGTITIVADTLDPVTLTAIGAPGGNGGAGGAGGAGAPGSIINKPGGHLTPPYPGGAGGNGGNGGSGGAGGNIAVTYVNPGPAGKLSVTTAMVAGGVAGVGGAAGPGGAGASGGIVAPAGKAGTAGTNGTAGAAGKLTVSVIPQSGYWPAVIAALTPANLTAWATYRLSVGRYFNRTFNAADPTNSGDLVLATTEFSAVQAMGVSAPAASAAQWSGWIANNLNALGLPYDYWVKPDFANFEATYVGYLPVIAPLVTAVGQLVTDAAIEASLATQLGVLQTEVQNEQGALTVNLAATQQVASDAQTTLTDLSAQLTALQNQINAEQQQLQQAEYEFQANLPWTVAWDVVQAVLDLAAAAVPVLGLAGIVIPAGSALAASVASLTATIAANKGQIPQSIGQDIGGLSALVGDVGKALGLFQNLSENSDTTITADQQAIQQLTTQSLNLKWQILLQGDQVTESQLNVAAVNAHISAAAADLTTITAAETQTASNLAAVAGLIGSLMDAIARISEFVLRYVFLAARALDTFGFTDGVAVAPATAAAQPLANVYQLPMSFGITAPDLLAEAQLALGRDNDGPAVALFSSLATNWAAAVPTWASYTDQGISLGQQFSPGQVWIPVTDPAVIAQLQSPGQSASFQIGFAELPAGSYELKLTQIYLNLVGATSSVPSLAGTMTHAGYAQATRRDGATLLLSSPPMQSFVSIGLTSGQIPPPATVPVVSSPAVSSPAAAAAASTGTSAVTGSTTSDAELQMFYGRSPVTTWSFTITDPTPVDLAGVTEIQVGLEFVAIAAGS
jgi:hypothetical protein